MRKIASAPQTLWGIHAGKTGDANFLFLEKKVIALGWHGMGDLSTLPATREAFKQRYTVVYPEAAKQKPGQVPTSAGQLFRFVHEMQINDLVVYPSKNPREIHLGRITGEYIHEASDGPHYPQRRAVEWLKAISRSNFTQGALYEIGSAISLFSIKNYADEFLSAIYEKQPPSPIPVEKDESVVDVSLDIEETARDYVLKALAQQIKGHPFSYLVANLLQTMGYRTRVSPEGPDGGIDIVAHTDELGFAPPIIKVQCKSTEGGIGAPLVKQLAGNIAATEFGLFVALGHYTKQATEFASSKSNLRLIDGDELVNLILEHYEALDAKYKALIPMRRVYVPQPLGDDSSE